MIEQCVINHMAELALLKKNWDGCGADPPDFEALVTALAFLNMASEEAPNILSYFKVVPSSTGGVCVIFENGPRRAYIEFHNEDVVTGIFSYEVSANGSEPNKPKITPRIITEFDGLLSEIEKHLEG